MQLKRCAILVVSSYTTYLALRKLTEVYQNQVYLRIFKQDYSGLSVVLK